MGRVEEVTVRTVEQSSQLRVDRGLLIDSVQVARIRHDIMREKYAAWKATATEFLNARDILAEAEAALRAHEEVYGKDV